MRIEKITIENYRCFEGEFHFPLKEGINVLVGNNEAGKSTILEAIHLALSGLIGGKYFQFELNEYLFNQASVSKYVDSLATDKPLPPPKITVEVHFQGGEFPDFKGTENLKKEDTSGLFFRVELDERLAKEYEAFIKEGNVKSLPIEYYTFYWMTFASDPITPRTIPIKSALIDSSSNKHQNGSDVYINRIIRDFLNEKERISVSQAHRMMKETFMNDASIKSINARIHEASPISDKQVALSVDGSSKNSWETTLVTFLDKIPFQYIGQGEQCIVKTKLALSHKKAQEASIILLEEPENHLSHSKMNKLIKQLTENADGKQILISTHSSFVANKLGLESLVLLENQKILKLAQLDEDTELFFEKLAGYDTLRLILCKKAILVEGDSDELIVQRAYLDKYGRLPIEDEIDVISVGTSFLRFLEIAVALEKLATVVTDTDWSKEALEKKYADYLGENKKDNISICYDSEIDEGELEIGGKPFNYNTLEPKILKANDRATLNEIFETDFQTDDELRKYMKAHKTDCALKIFNAEQKINYPDYILESFK